MPGQIKSILESIIEQRANGNAIVAATTRTKLILRGLNPDRFNESSPDDPSVLARVRATAGEFGVTV